MSEWRPIETAPVGVHVLMWSPLGGPSIAPVADWQVSQQARIEAMQGLWRQRDRNLIEGADEGWNATHWMPLPEPPVTHSTPDQHI